MSQDNIEIEAHFIDVDTNLVKKKLMDLGAEDLGEDTLREIIFYDRELTWNKHKRFLRMRKNKNFTILSFKDFQYEDKNDLPNNEPVVKEIEITVDSWHQAKLLLEAVGLVAFREQEKVRHSYRLGDVLVDIDHWPSIPPYVEIEGPSREKIQHVAEKLGFEWEKAIFRGAGYIIEHYYHIPVTQLRSFTFDKIG